jgi:hypothetical protein
MGPSFLWVAFPAALGSEIESSAVDFSSGVLDSGDSENNAATEEEVEDCSDPNTIGFCSNSS